jgi:hypothetical protein
VVGRWLGVELEVLSARDCRNRTKATAELGQTRATRLRRRVLARYRFFRFNVTLAVLLAALPPLGVKVTLTVTLSFPFFFSTR